MPVAKRSKWGQCSQYEAEYRGEGAEAVEWIKPEEETFPVSLARGTAGVFDLEELVKLALLPTRSTTLVRGLLKVEFLKAEKARSLFVAAVGAGDEAEAASHVVIASPFSARHMRALFERLDKVTLHLCPQFHPSKWHLVQLYKKKKGPRDPFLTGSRVKTTEDWRTVNLGNIMLHIMVHSCSAIGPLSKEVSGAWRRRRRASGTTWSSCGQWARCWMPTPRRRGKRALRPSRSSHWSH